MGLEQRKLRADLVGFARAGGFGGAMNGTERELKEQLVLAMESDRLADQLLTCLRQSFSGPHVIPAGAVVEVLARTGGDEGDVYLIVRGADGVYADILQSLTDSVAMPEEP